MTKGKKSKSSKKKKTKSTSSSKWRQTGKSNTRKDLQRRARKPGPRVSKTGKRYTERRKNRSDKPGTRL